MRAFFLCLIRGYQRWLSPMLGTRCRFHPSCSRYSAEALLRFGSARGLLLGGCRVLRCHPLNAGGFDAVPVQFPAKFWRRNPDHAPPAQDAHAETFTHPPLPESSGVAKE